MQTVIRAVSRGSSIQRKGPKKSSTKIHYFSGEKFKIVRPLARDLLDAISLSVVGKTAWFLRVRGQYCFLEPKKQTRQFDKDCSFFPLVNLWFPEYVAFESVQQSAHYLRMKDGRLVLDHYNGTSDFKEEASFKMNLHNGFICNIDALKHSTDERISVHDEGRCSSRTSACVCSECVSVVSFQIFEENAPLCECSDCEDELGKSRKEEKNK